MLSIESLRVGYGSTPVLDGVDLTVPDGISCLMGRNGVGKTTLLNTVVGVLDGWGGTISFQGTDLARLRPDRRVALGLGYVPQGQLVFPQLSVRENLLVVAESAGRGVEEVVAEALELFPCLRELLNRDAGVLSGGQRQQLAMARGLARRPDLLLLDEPTEGLQPSIVDEIEDAIVRLHRERGMAVLLVEQYVDFALRLSDTYAVMEAGRVVAQGRVEELASGELGDLLAV